MRCLQLLLFLVCVVTSARAYHVLCVFPIPSRSHNSLGKGIVDALLGAGHEVTWATPFPPKESTKGLKIIDVSATASVSEMIDMNDQRNADAGIALIRTFAANITRLSLSVPALQQAIVSGKYDAVVTESFFNDAEAGYGAVLQVPWILLSSVSIMPHLEAIIDEVRSITTIPLLFNNAPTPMGFWDRLTNIFIYSAMTISNWLERPNTVAFYESLFAPLAAARGIALPPFEEALYNVSVLLVNSHPAFAPPMSLPPNVVEIGGYHINPETPPLPKDLQHILDSSPQGVVYFSMGSVLKSSRLSERTRREILEVFGSLSQTVLWKFEEELKDLPKNVIVRPWMPQSSILAHPNVKVFITHGGLLSTLETLHYGVPILAVPVFGDQPSNADRAVRHGFAKSIQYKPDMANDMKVALNEMLSNDSYYTRARYLSKIFGDKLVPPAKLISHYVKVAIETNGAYHLRSKSLLYPWYQRWLVDIIAALLLACLAVYVAARRVLCYLWSSVNGGDCNRIKVKKN
ncbi:UDP-glycosyltransferase UGT41A2 isoform X1 [Bombyx mori]|uniref:UDP-glucuronosyltransferase n=1 Tax=Bombyx mori TaxID=7091 RepID=A0A8R2M626_BOMMO|nr:UDP-glycosyltransferase UGT41A2 isoform X1 [Bombyx mori]